MENFGVGGQGVRLHGKKGVLLAYSGWCPAGFGIEASCGLLTLAIAGGSRGLGGRRRSFVFTFMKPWNLGAID